MQSDAAASVNAQRRKNDEARMTNDEVSPNAQMSKSHYFVIRHSDFVIYVANCAISILRETFLSVRGYGLRAYEPRQGRNAATVV